jgi:predicted branched-subunit amino acid permease
MLGAAIQKPEALALDFAFFDVFTALTISLWQGKKDALPGTTRIFLIDFNPSKCQKPL